MLIKSVPWTSDVVAFLRLHGDHRITQGALDYFSSEPDKAWIIEATVAGVVVAYSCSALVDGKLMYSVTVTALVLRNKGIGTKVLIEKVRQIEEEGHHYKTLVAEDNAPSRRMCEKSTLALTSREIRTRRSGEYTALTFETYI